MILVLLGEVEHTQDIGEGVKLNLILTPVNWKTRLRKKVLETQETLLAVLEMDQ